MLYILGMKRIIYWQDKILTILNGMADAYCLGGGTALSKFYFGHRQSFDLDFFTIKYSRKAIISLMEYVSDKSGKNFKIIREQQKKNMVHILIFSASLNKQESLKIDFIEDYLKRLKPPKLINGIFVLSLEDIYLRKIYAVSGTIDAVDLAGKKMIKGGRQEAKDFYDLYFLSHTFMNLSKFALEYCDSIIQEGLIYWYRTYPRIEIISGLFDLQTKNKIDYKNMEKHFKDQIGIIIEKQIEEV